MQQQLYYVVFERDSQLLKVFVFNVKLEREGEGGRERINGGLLVAVTFNYVKQTKKS